MIAGDFGEFYTRHGSPVGGCYRWQLDLETKERRSGLVAINTITKWQVKTNRWWLLDDVSQVTAEFYKVVNDRPILLVREQVGLVFDREKLELDKLLSLSIVMEKTE